MKLFIARSQWIGNHPAYIKSSLQKEVGEIGTNTNVFRLSKALHAAKLHHFLPFSRMDFNRALNTYNEGLLAECISFKPDVFMIFNESRVSPLTIKSIKEKCKCLMVCILADDPWDSTRWVTDFPHSLKYFDLIFIGEPTWNINLKRVAPDAKVFLNFGGFDPDFYFPVNPESLSESDKETFSCDVSFTGSAYGNKAEGAYRADILSFLTAFNLKIWGDDNWEYRLKYLPELKPHLKGTRLSLDDLRKLYLLSGVNLNLPAPQVVTSFQPRIFEIAACKGFQIVDNRKLVRKYFTEDELVTFDTIEELREKIRYYTSHETERLRITENLYRKVADQYTWEQWAKMVVNTIRHPGNYEHLS